MHTLELTIHGNWHLTAACHWMANWVLRSGSRYFYRGVMYLTDDGGDRIALAVQDMDESDLLLFKMKFGAEVRSGDLYYGEMGYD